MSVSRFVILCLLALAVLVLYAPSPEGQVQENLDYIRPAVVAVMDGLYATIRTLIAGDVGDEHIDDQPVSPGADFDRIVTMGSGLHA